MVPDELDPVVISKLTLQQVEQVTCVECCKYYIAPETASCGHTLCHGCWSGRRSCPTCATHLDRQALRLNIPLQTLTDHVHALGDVFEKLFNIKLDEFVLDLPDNVINVESDPSKNVKDWLASSQNHFSAPALGTQQSTQDGVQSLELSSNKIQIHTTAEKSLYPSKALLTKKMSPMKAIYTAKSQEDWDKIETLPDTEDINIKNKENIVGLMDVEPFVKEYSTEHPRRSARNKEMNTGSNVQTRNMVLENSKDSSHEIEKMSVKTKQNWSNVKKMSKEFSKLNNQIKNKLNVSIEMCKKAQSGVNISKPITSVTVSQPAFYVIDDNTPDLSINEKEILAKKSLNESLKYNQAEKSDSNNAHETFQHKIIDIESTGDTKSKEDIIDINTGNMQHNKTNNSIKNDKHLSNNNTKNNNDSSVQTGEIISRNVPIFKKSVLHQKTTNDNSIKVTQTNINPCTESTASDDIEISIKIGTTVTNIVIKKKENDVQLKLNVDREIQTSSHLITSDKNDMSCSPMRQDDHQIVGSNQENSNKTNNIVKDKAASSKKNTDSADTRTANFEITESVEKELSDLMECVESVDTKSKDVKKTLSITSKSAKSSQIKEIRSAQKDNEILDDDLNDLDIFDSGSVTEVNVQLLKNTKQTPSEVIMPTLKKKRRQKVSDKRDRDGNDETEMPCNKKQKIDSENIIKDVPCPKSVQDKNKDIDDSEPMNYDAIMSQVFANIDADMKGPNTQSVVKLDKPKDLIKTKVIASAEGLNSSNSKEIAEQKYSENVFSILEKDSQSHVMKNKNIQEMDTEPTQQRIDNLLTPGMCRALASSNRDEHIMQTNNNEIEIMEEELGTPIVDHDDSDKSVVEETPQKNLSFSKPKQISNKNLNNNDKPQPLKVQSSNEMQTESQIIKSIINISDSLRESNEDATVVEILQNKQSETPLTITKFVGHIKHNSTPVARKSLNFDSENVEDSERTLCPTTTQEKEFLSKAFEQTPKSSVHKELGLKNIRSREDKTFCLAGSCLSFAEQSNVKKLCLSRGWAYVDKYTKDLTHLIVGVDEENKSQRSVKYMCALAASKWIITYTWVVKCLQKKDIVDELPYEALDACGEPGPKRSRVAERKLFEGFTFYCMSPFSVLDVETLKHMLEASGGRVVNSVDGVKLTSDKEGMLALLLAEPEHTEEDRFTYLAMDLSIVPVNYEWVLNCLGSYTLTSLHDLLLCSPSLLPEVTKQWPAPLLLREMDDSDI